MLLEGNVAASGNWPDASDTGFYHQPLPVVRGVISHFLRVVGAFLYLYMHIKIWSRLWAANIHFKKIHGRLHPQLWGLFICLTAMAFNLVLNPGLAYAQGITLASIGFALASLYLA